MIPKKNSKQLIQYNTNCYYKHFNGKRGDSGSIPDGVTGIFHWHNLFLQQYDPGVDSVSNRNKYQEFFQWGKGGRCVGLTTLPLSCADCVEIWETQPPWTVRDCFNFTYKGAQMLRDNAMKNGGGDVEVKIHTFLTFALKACGRSASSFVPFTPLTVWRLTTHIWVVPHR